MDPATLSVISLVGAGLGWLVSFGNNALGLYHAVRGLRPDRDVPALVARAPRRHREPLQGLYQDLEIARPHVLRLVRRVVAIQVIAGLVGLLVVWMVLWWMRGLVRLDPAVLSPMLLAIGAGAIWFFVALNRNPGQSDRLNNIIKSLRQGLDEALDMARDAAQKPARQRMFNRVLKPDERDFLTEYLVVAALVQRLESNWLKVRLRAGSAQFRSVHQEMIRDLIAELLDDMLASPTYAALSDQDLLDEIYAEMNARNFSHLLRYEKGDVRGLFFERQPPQTIASTEVGRYRVYVGDPPKLVSPDQTTVSQRISAGELLNLKDVVYRWPPYSRMAKSGDSPPV